MYLFRCLAVSIAFRRDARPRPTGCATPNLLPHSNQLFISAATSLFIIHHSSFSFPPYGFVPLPLPCDEYYLSAGREAPPLRFVRRPTNYPHSNRRIFLERIVFSNYMKIFRIPSSKCPVLHTAPTKNLPDFAWCSWISVRFFHSAPRFLHIFS